MVMYRYFVNASKQQQQDLEAAFLVIGGGGEIFWLGWTKSFTNVGSSELQLGSLAYKGEHEWYQRLGTGHCTLKVPIGWAEPWTQFW